MLSRHPRCSHIRHQPEKAEVRRSARSPQALCHLYAQEHPHQSWARGQLAHHRARDLLCPRR